jgi:hypothetical protein
MTFEVDRLGPPPEDQVYHFVERLMPDELMPFAKPKMSLMSCPRRWSLCQELKGVSPSARQAILSFKSDLAGVIGGRKTINRYEKEFGASMDRPKILVTDLKMLIKEACAVAHLRFMIKDCDRHHILNRATKQEMV